MGWNFPLSMVACKAGRSGFMMPDGLLPPVLAGAH